MSITIADVMKLPSMRGAKVLGGAGGLARVVSSISVLEYAQTSAIQSELFDRVEFLGNELAITGFMNNPDDVELQCTNIRRMASIGEVGVILFYVGIVMKKVDRLLIDLANALNFPLICMPVGQMNQRYSEVICEVMELIYRDQMAGANLVSELLEQAAGLAPHQRTVDSMLRMLADRLHASVVLMDSSRRVLNEAAWPRSFNDAIKEQLTAAEFPAPGAWGYCEAVDVHIYRDGIQTRDRHAMDLLIFKEGDALDVVLTRQAVEVVQLTVSIWSDKHDRIVIGELVRAILQDEPMKMRRLAEIFHVDVAAIHEMWIIQSDAEEAKARFKQALPALRECFAGFSGSLIMDVYGGRLLLFMSTPLSQQEAERMTEAVMETVTPGLPDAALCRCSGLMNTADVRAAYLSCKENLADVMKIYPARRAYTLGDLDFAHGCRSLIQSGEAALAECLRPLLPVQKDNEELDLAETLAVFLLDGESSVTMTSELLYLHKNTVKYRIRRISNLLGYKPDKMPEMLELYKACAVKRLLLDE